MVRFPIGSGQFLDQQHGLDGERCHFQALEQLRVHAVVVWQIPNLKGRLLRWAIASLGLPESVHLAKESEVVRFPLGLGGFGCIIRDVEIREDGGAETGQMFEHFFDGVGRLTSARLIGG
jgi:hypothetical protein